MKMKLLNISGKLNKYTLNVYEIISQQASNLHIPFFIIGASARDLILEHGYEFPPKRATLDIDISIQVSKWGEVDQLKRALVQTELFKDNKKYQRLIFKESSIPVDIVPFGKIEDEEHNIKWPPDYGFKMSVIAFQDAYRHAVIVRLRESPRLEIQVISIPGLIVLKLLA